MSNSQQIIMLLSFFLLLFELLVLSQCLTNNTEYLKPAFTRFGLPANLDCGRFLANDETYLKNYANHRISQNDDVPLAMDCASIRERHFFPDKAMSRWESEFPIAFARTVYKDYLFIEAEFAATFAPQNYYCFALDAKSGGVFRKRMQSLANCFPNVVLTKRELAMDSQGHNQSASQYECMKELANSQRKWRYLLVAQNRDVILKSNEELVQIFRWFQGANDIEICAPVFNRLNPKLDWSFSALQLFRNNSTQIKGRLKFAKGYLESAISREFVDFVVHKLDLSRMLAQIDTGKCFVDEHFLQMLSISEDLDVPGRFTHFCLDKGHSTPYVTKLVAWFANSSRCHSRHVRHHACIFGMEDLGPLFSISHSLLANKMKMDFDWGAIRCWHEHLHNRTYIQRGTHRLKASVYLELPLVRYNLARVNGNKSPEKSGFQCAYRISAEDAEKMYDGRMDQRIKKFTEQEIQEHIQKESQGCHAAESKR